MITWPISNIWSIHELIAEIVVVRPSSGRCIISLALCCFALMRREDPLHVVAGPGTIVCTLYCRSAAHVGIYYSNNKLLQ